MSNNRLSENPATPGESAAERAPEKKKWGFIKKVLVLGGGLAALAALPVVAQHMGLGDRLGKTGAEWLSKSSEFVRKHAATGATAVSTQAQRFSKLTRGILGNPPITDIAQATDIDQVPNFQ